MPSETFSKNVYLKDGSLIYTNEAHISNILHEAGHLAIFPSEIRKIASGSLSVAYRTLGELISKMDIYDEVKLQSYMGCDDDGATAWAWCVGLMLGYKPKEIIRNRDYGNGGQDVREGLQTRYYSGVKRLYYLGLLKNTMNFPKLDRYLNPY